jgi:hypothetical protein
MSFYQTKKGHLARRKGGVSKERILNDPNYARTRENINEFSGNIQAVKWIRETIRPAVSKMTDAELHQRLVRQMMKVLRTDPVNLRGKRKVAEGDWSLLEGFQLNTVKSVDTVIKMDLKFTDSPTDWGITLDPFFPSEILSIPKGATHFRLLAAAASFDFAAGEKTLIQRVSADIDLELETATITLGIDKSELLQPIRIFIFGIEFFQLVNGRNYPLIDLSHNTGYIVTAEKA